MHGGSEYMKGNRLVVVKLPRGALIYTMKTNAGFQCRHLSDRNWNVFYAELARICAPPAVPYWWPAWNYPVDEFKFS